jgi:ribose transport system substrate-binding protein
MMFTPLQSLPNPSKPVRMQDIADKAGVSRAAVSMAMHNHPSLPLETRVRIQRLAQELGYRPDPLVSSLMSHQRAGESVRSDFRLGFITDQPTREGWKQSRAHREFYEGAAAGADRHGYRLEEFWLAEPGMSAARLSQVLLTRNIPGLLFPPLAVVEGGLEMAWDKFAAVTCGYSMSEPSLHRVSHHQFRSMLLLLTRLRELGYERPGLVLCQSLAERELHPWLTGFQMESGKGARRRVPPLLLAEERASRQRFGKWLEQHRPDVVIGSHEHVLEWVQETGREVPEEMGFVALDCPTLNGSISGIYQNGPEVGVAAAELLVGMLHWNELGLPAMPRTLLIEGSWVQGTTTRLPEQTYRLRDSHGLLSIHSETQFAKSATTNPGSLAWGRLPLGPPLRSATVPDGKGEVLIGVALMNLALSWFFGIEEGMQRTALKHGNVKLIYENGKFDVNTQARQLEHMAKLGVKGVVVFPVDEAAIIPTMKALAKKGIKIVVCDYPQSPANQEDEVWETFVGHDLREMGEVAGDLAVKYLRTRNKSRPVCVYLSIPACGQASVHRFEGFRAAIKRGFPGAEVIEQRDPVGGTGDIQSAQTIFRNLLVQRNDIEVVSGHNDWVVLGAYRAALAEKKVGRMKFIGLAGQRDVLQYIAARNPAWLGEVLQDPVVLGEAGLAALLAALAGKKFSKRYPIIRPQAITPDNIDRFNWKSWKWLGQ